jgi:NADH-quinone oxidoreductase subunit G
LGRSLESVESLDAALIVAASLRYEQPLLSHRLRKAVIHNAARVSSIGHIGGEYNFSLRSELTGSAAQLVCDLGAVVVALAQLTDSSLSARMSRLLGDCQPGDDHKAIAKSLFEGDSSAVIVGVQALSNPDLSLIQELCETITNLSNSTLGYLSPSANSTGASLAGATPHRTAAGTESDAVGEHTGQILTSQHQVLLTFGVNPGLDIDTPAELADNNKTVIAISSFNNDFVQQQVDMVLPLAGVFESSGSFVNIEGLWQSFRGCVKARGESRQGWKILCALGQILLPGKFDYADSVAVKDELKSLCHDVTLSNLCGLQAKGSKLPGLSPALQKISQTPIYASDDMVRQSSALRATPLMKAQSAVVMNRQQAETSKLIDCEQVHIKQGKGTAVLPLRIDESIPTGCVYIPVGIDAVKHLSSAYGKVDVEKLS